MAAAAAARRPSIVFVATAEALKRKNRHNLVNAIEDFFLFTCCNLELLLTELNTKTQVSKICLDELDKYINYKLYKDYCGSQAKHSICGNGRSSGRTEKEKSSLNF